VVDFGVALGRVLVRTAEAGGTVDLTAQVEGFLKAAGLEAGWVNVHTRHATTGICIGEEEPLPRTAETLSVAGGHLLLGRQQRVLLVERDGPREREVSLLAMGERRG
jgi:thiamine phosphate synthase YjbQ (UPF0047 family)